MFVEKRSEVTGQVTIEELTFDLLKEISNASDLMPNEVTEALGRGERIYTTLHSYKIYTAG